MDAPGPFRRRGVLTGFPNSADLGGLPLPGGRAVPSGRIVRADTPARLDGDGRAAAEAFGFTTVVDLRSADELLACAHPLTGLLGYRSLPLIDPAAEAGEDLSRYGTLGEIYASSLQRNAAHIAAIFAALAAAPPGPVLVCCRAGRDRTGMVVALLLDLAGVERDVIAADYALVPDRAAPADAASIRRMLDHVGGAYGTTAGYLRGLGLDEAAVAFLRRRLEP